MLYDFYKNIDLYPNKKFWETGCDYWGNDFKSIKGVSSVEDCFIECRSAVACTHFAYEASYKRCYLKKADYIKLTFVNDPTVYCGIMNDTKAIKKPVRRNELRLYNHYNHLGAKTVNDCWDECIKDDNCTAVSYAPFNWDRPRCYLFAAGNITKLTNEKDWASLFSQQFIKFYYLNTKKIKFNIYANTN